MHVTKKNVSVKEEEKWGTSSKKKLAQKEKVGVESVAASPSSDFVEEPIMEMEDAEDEEIECEVENNSSKKLEGKRRIKSRIFDRYEEMFTGEPFSEEEARRRWPHRYVRKGKNKRSQSGDCKDLNDGEDEVIDARRHFAQALVDGHIFKLEENVYVKADDNTKDYIGKIVEMFETVDGKFYFTAQSFYRAEDTAIQQCSDLIDDKRIFFSEIKDVNPLNCLVKVLRINRIPPNMDKMIKETMKSNCDYYYDMMYILPYCTFASLPPDDMAAENESVAIISSEIDVPNGVEVCQDEHSLKMKLLDLYSGWVWSNVHRIMLRS